jgi:hypothetical protein
VKPYKLQLLQAVSDEDKTRQYSFCNDMFECMELEDNFLTRIDFSDEAMFHNSGKVNKHNIPHLGNTKSTGYHGAQM